jgi:hypothetical protein
VTRPISGGGHDVRVERSSQDRSGRRFNPSQVPVWVVGVAGLAVGVAFALRIMLPYGMDPTVFIRLGDESPVQTSYARGLLGEAISRDDFAHDGRWFFIQANDPWYLEPERHAVVLDRPLYRAQRMLFPTIAGGFGFFPPGLIVWTLLITNLAWLGLGATLAAKLAVSRGLSPWLGLWVPLNPGLLFELEIGGAGILAYTCCIAAVYALAKERWGWASLLFAGAALSREVMVLFAAGVFTVMWLDGRRPLLRILIAPCVAMAVWYAYIRSRLSGISGAGGGQDAFSAPFVGIARAFRIWAQHPSHVLINIAILAVVVVFVVVAFRSRSLLAWGALPFVFLATVLSVNVWRETHDIVRALSPVFTAIPFLVAASRQGGRRQQPLLALKPR